MAITIIDVEYLMAVVAVTSAVWSVIFAWRMRKTVREIEELLRKRRGG